MNTPSRCAWGSAANLAAKASAAAAVLSLAPVAVFGGAWHALASAASASTVMTGRFMSLSSAQPIVRAALTFRASVRRSALERIDALRQARVTGFGTGSSAVDYYGCGAGLAPAPGAETRGRNDGGERDGRSSDQTGTDRDRPLQRSRRGGGVVEPARLFAPRRPGL